MTKLANFLIGVLISLCVVLYCEHAHADCLNIQKDGATQFTAQALLGINGLNWNFASCTVQAPPPAAGRQTVAHIAYGGTGSGGGQVVRDVTQWQSVFGHSTTTDAVIAWPGRHDSQPTIVDLRRGSYIALEVHTNALGQIPTFGFVGSTEYNRGFDPAISWARSPGDFSASLGTKCYAARVLSGGQLGQYATPLVGYLAACHLPSNATVYFNLKMADPTQATPMCAASSPTCPFGMTNNFN